MFPVKKALLFISAVAPFLDFVTLVEKVHVMIFYDSLDVLHAAITRFNLISVKYLVKGVVFWGNVYLLGADLFLLLHFYCMVG